MSHPYHSLSKNVRTVTSETQWDEPRLGRELQSDEKLRNMTNLAKPERIMTMHPKFTQTCESWWPRCEPRKIVFWGSWSPRHIKEEKYFLMFDLGVPHIVGKLRKRCFQQA